MAGCTVMPPASLDISSCKWGDVECIGQKYDEQRFSEEFQESCIPWKPMEGYEPPSYTELKQRGLIDVDTMIGIPVISTAVGVPLLGYNTVWFGETGDILKSKMRYMAGLPNSMIAHEITHLYCRDKGLLGWMGKAPYTPKQMEIMKNEGVDRWTDTSYYKKEDSSYHYIYKKGEKWVQKDHSKRLVTIQIGDVIYVDENHPRSNQDFVMPPVNNTVHCPRLSSAK